MVSREKKQLPCSRPSPPASRKRTRGPGRRRAVTPRAAGEWASGAGGGEPGPRAGARPGDGCRGCVRRVPLERRAGRGGAGAQRAEGALRARPSRWPAAPTPLPVARRGPGAGEAQGPLPGGAARGAPSSPRPGVRRGGTPSLARVEQELLARRAAFPRVAHSGAKASLLGRVAGTAEPRPLCIRALQCGAAVRTPRRGAQPSSFGGARPRVVPAWAPGAEPHSVEWPESRCRLLVGGDRKRVPYLGAGPPAAGGSPPP